MEMMPSNLRSRKAVGPGPTPKSDKSTTEKKSAHHVAKSMDQSTSPDENAFRQALRGCATQQDQSQRDSCLNEAIGKFQRNT
jgi:hypothetical protein